MANSLSGNPFVIDTPAAAAIFDTPLNIRRMEYVFSNQTDICEVQDANGNIIAVLTGNSSGQPSSVDSPPRSMGLLVPLTTTAGAPNLPNGRLLLYFV